MKLFITEDQITKGIALSHKAGQSWQSGVHRILCSIVALQAKDSDHKTCVRLCNDVVKAMPEGSRSNAVKDWIHVYTGYHWNKDEKAFVFQKVAGFKLDLEAAIKEPFWLLTKEQEYQPIQDWTKMLKTLVEKAKKDITQQGENTKVDIEQLKVLAKMAGIAMPMAKGEEPSF